MYDAQRFLEALFGDKPKESLIAIWTKKPTGGGPTKYYSNVAKAALSVIDKPDVYFGCALAKENLGIHRRGDVDNTAGIVGLWLDVDVKHECHSKTECLPPDLDAAKTLLYGHGWDPTALVWSGHGLHAWWLFKEPWMYLSTDNDVTVKERTRAALLEYRLHKTIRARAAEKGWVVDSVHDLTRVLRPPDTINAKEKGKEVGVELLDLDESRRYNPEDLDEFLLEAEEWELEKVSTVGSAKPGASDTYKDYRFDGMLDPKVLDMCEAMHGVRFTMTYKKLSTTQKDKSPSGWDMTIANLASQSGCTKQQIIDLLISFRLKHGVELKMGTNKQYYVRTAQKALDDCPADADLIKDLADRSNDFLETPVLAVPSPDIQRMAHSAQKIIPTKISNTITIPSDKESIDESIDEFLDILTMRFGTTVLEVTRWESDPYPTFEMTVETKDGRTNQIPLGDISNLTTMKKFQDHFAAITLSFVEMERKEWPAIRGALLGAAISRPVPFEITVVGKMFDYLCEYLSTSASTTPLTMKEAIKDREPYVYEDMCWCIFLRPFRKALMRSGDIVTEKELIKGLQKIGAETVKINTTVDGRRHHTQSWKIPNFPEIPVPKTTFSVVPGGKQSSPTNTSCSLGDDDDDIKTFPTMKGTE